MSIPWSERQLRIAEIKRRQMKPPEKPRLALRVARHFIGDDYDEEVFPAWLINLFGVTSIIVEIVAAPFVFVFFVAKWVGRVLKEVGIYMVIFCVGCAVLAIEAVGGLFSKDPDKN